MNKILTLNNISNKGLDRLPKSNYSISDKEQQPDAILLRSFNMHEFAIPETLKAVGRAGAGVNNIPVDAMSGKGIVVFNAPGANANAVKELVIAGMLIACRNICHAWDYTAQLEGDDDTIEKAVEAGKKKYVGFELPGKTLGVVGLGAIGVLVANAARALGMNVLGYDPSVTVQNAWKLSSEIQQSASVDVLLKQSDFVTFHVPLIESTKNLINQARLKNMKQGVVILNFARGGIIDNAAVLEAINTGKVYAYVCDFPNKAIKNHKGVIALPHLGASTEEAEENCAVMVADQVREYLENGTIRNSVNFPEVQLPRAGTQRLAIANENRPAMVSQISQVLGELGVNIVHMVNESRGQVAYTLLDVENNVDAKTIEKIKSIAGILSVRAI